MTIVSTGDEYMKNQVLRQLEKLQDVKMVVLLEKEKSVSIEHMLIKLKIGGDGKTAISDLINDYGGKVMDFGDSFITAEIAGSSEKIERFIDATRAAGIMEICRSGLISMTQGTENILSLGKPGIV